MLEKEKSKLNKIIIIALCFVAAFFILRSNFQVTQKSEKVVVSPPSPIYREISGNIEKGETLFDIFKRYKLDITDLFKLREASADIHRLRNLYPGRPYKIIIDENSQINEFVYWIDDDHFLNITRTDEGFAAEKVALEYEKRIFHIGGIVKDNLISSIGENGNNLLLALNLSDIFSWDIDFTTDLRNGDSFKIVVEGFYLDGAFKKYGEILSAEFLNNGEVFHAYRFVNKEEVDYYDNNGKSLRRSFLKAPLNFRRISSGFSKKRFHPVLKIYRPHLGVDYAAAAGTPVSSVGEGKVIFAGYKGQNGKIVIIQHTNGYKTYYGHLSKIRKGIRRGSRVKQGQVVGYVGSTGLATGPHLDYRVKINNRFINPLTLKLPRGKSIPKAKMAEFKGFMHDMRDRLASIKLPSFTFADKKTDTNKI